MGVYPGQSLSVCVNIEAAFELSEFLDHIKQSIKPCSIVGERQESDDHCYEEENEVTALKTNWFLYANCHLRSVLGPDIKRKQEVVLEPLAKAYLRQSP